MKIRAGNKRRLQKFIEGCAMLPRLNDAIRIDFHPKFTETTDDESRIELSIYLTCQKSEADRITDLIAIAAYIIADQQNARDLGFNVKELQKVEEFQLNGNQITRAGTYYADYDKGTHTIIRGKPISNLARQQINALFSTPLNYNAPGTWNESRRVGLQRKLARGLG